MVQEVVREVVLISTTPCEVSSTKRDLNELVVEEWDVCRRTAEFFDNQLGRLREIGLTSSVAIVGLALQFQPAIGVLLIPMNAIFTLLDVRTQRYLTAASSYAKEIESKYRFVGDGLTNSVRKKIGGKEKSLYNEFVYFINGVFIVTGAASFVLTYNRIYTTTIALFGSLVIFVIFVASGAVTIAVIVILRRVLAKRRVRITHSIEEIECLSQRTYNVLAAEYYTSSHPTSQVFDRIVDDYLRTHPLTLKPNEYYLDVGGGRTKLSSETDEEESKVVVIDLSKGMIVQTEKAVADRVVASAFRLAIRLNSLKGIHSFLGDAFSISPFFEQVYDSLKTGGYFLLVIPNHKWATTLRETIRIPSDMTVFASKSGRLFAPSFTIPMKSLESQLSEIGFHVIDAQELFLPPDFPRDQLPEHIALPSKVLKIDPYCMPILTVVRAMK